ncbi:DUF4142 domain-containing protein [Caballeronia sp. GAFFF1]|uniref:DUF4142 domain-containing protein n=1 Tax=Caballeronia sp. GAFFF1 TaxID=2921779 RepID=UPI002027F757|nr:DUF4142 domain-containing protein [Caballeronia sp. GAFFF1]
MCQYLKGPAHPVFMRDMNAKVAASMLSRLHSRAVLASLVCAAAFSSAGCRLMQSGAQVSPTDQQFMLTAASVGKAEIDLGKLASERGGSPAVREFGQKMVAEHTRINGELSQIADEKHVRLLQAMDPANRTLYDELGTMTGAAFDHEYAIAQVHIHQMGNALYASEAQHGEDAQVKAFAARGVPIGENHLQHASQLLQDLPISSAQ